MSLSTALQMSGRVERTGLSPPLAPPLASPLVPALGRCLLGVIMLAALVAGFVATDSDTAARAVAAAGPDLTRLLRAMAGLKALIAVGLAAVVLWRLAAPVRPGWFAAYALACAATAMGPGLIWQMAHVGAGAVVLHGGLLAGLLLLWRDPVVGERLQAMVATRRARLR